MMRQSTKITTFLIAVLAFTATGCYTQLYTTNPSSSGGYYTSSSENERVTSGNQSLEQRGDEVVNEEDYTLGYDDGWSDAEGYYFKDYDAQRWYEDYGVNLAHNPYVRHYTLNQYRYTSGYSPYHSFYYPHYPYYSHVNSFSFSLGFHIGWGWNHWYPHYRYSPRYNYYAYPGYYPYYGGYWGYGPYYGNTVVIYNGTRGTTRNYGPRSNGLTSRGSAVTRRTRSDAQVRNTAPRSSVRSDARSRNVSTTRSRGTVNRSSGTTRSRSSSTVRSRSGSSSNNRGTVNRSGSNNRSRSSGSSVNRSSSSSSNRGNGTVNRSRSSNQSRANVGSEGVIISRGNSIITNRENDPRRSTTTDRSAITNTRSRTATSVNNRINSYNSQQDRSRVEMNRPQTRQQRSLNSLRSRLLNQNAESPDRHYTPAQSRSTNIFNNRAVRSVINSAIGNSSSNRSRSSGSYGSSSSSSSSRSSSVSRSRSNNSSGSSVRSSRSSSSSSKSRSSSSRSRSSSSRDRN